MPFNCQKYVCTRTSPLFEGKSSKIVSFQTPMFYDLDIAQGNWTSCGSPPQNIVVPSGPELNGLEILKRWTPFVQFYSINTENEFIRLYGWEWNVLYLDSVEGTCCWHSQKRFLRRCTYQKRVSDRLGSGKWVSALSGFGGRTSRR